MSGYRGGIFRCPFYGRDYKDYLNCEGAQLRMRKRVLDRYTKHYCAGAWEQCSIARRLVEEYEAKEAEKDDKKGAGA